MDRRQRKSREAIFTSFINLLSQKSFNQITVADIIEGADVGRATFYAHFETKDFLLKELCRELFCHISDLADNGDAEHRHIFSCDTDEPVFLHLLRHLTKNDNHILELLSGQNNELFISYFKSELLRLTEKSLSDFSLGRKRELPKEFLINHIACTFVETVNWWIREKMKQSPEEIYSYFILAVES